MSIGTICCIRRNPAISHAWSELGRLGYAVSVYPTRGTTHLLLPVPSFSVDSGYLEALLPELPPDVTVIGGNLNIPPLQSYRKLDLLQDPYYLAENAAITARCAIRLAEERTALQDQSALVLGWGRIGKCLGRFLEKKDARVTVAARNPKDLAILSAMGYDVIPIDSLTADLTNYRIILNTVPAMILPKTELAPDCVALELASVPGMIGESVISARGLPGRMAPEESGKLIARTTARLLSV